MKESSLHSVHSLESKSLLMVNGEDSDDVLTRIMGKGNIQR